MIFAKPESGFNLVLSDKSQRQIDNIIAEFPRVAPQWEAVCKRIVFTGHRDGARVKILDESNVFIVAYDLHDMPDIQIVFSLLGDTLTIRAIRILE